jgi:hypothetical protein|tara:strand:- start:3317 stop:4924 length:1608 start_codon:yes stop_codon:yes gene_type:complete
MTPPAIAVRRHAAEMRRDGDAKAREGGGAATRTAAAATAAGGFPFAMPGNAMMMAAFGPNVEGLRRQAAVMKGGMTDGGVTAPMIFAPMPFNPFAMMPMVGMGATPAGATFRGGVDDEKKNSPSASDGSHRTTTHVDGEDVEGGERVEAGQEATCSGRGLAMMIPPPPMLTVPTSLKNARLEALSVPDRTQTPGIQSPFSAANVLCAMMTRGSDDENEHPTAPAPKPRGQGKRRSEYLGPLSVRCPKKRRTMKTSRARSNLTTFDAAPSAAPKPPSAPEAARFDVGAMAAPAKPKTHRPWSLPEVKALVRGVTHYGRGQWADIKALRLDGVSDALVNRSAVDLKDKWRNLLRVAMLPALYKRREVNGVPADILEQVRVLASSKGNEGAQRSSKENRAPRSGTSVATVKAAATDAVTAVKAEPIAASPSSNVKGVRRSKHHSPWTAVEAEALVDGVERCGGCRWTVIKKSDDPALERRTAMDLKDKWRNLLQLASLPAQSRRKQDTPPEFLERVLDLEARYGNARRKGRKSVVKTA